MYTKTLPNGIVVKINTKDWVCPFLCGRCDLGRDGIKKCKCNSENEENNNGCVYLIGLSDVPYYDD